MRCTISLAAAFLVAGPVHAALDPEPKTPYQWRIILRIADHPNFTEHFRREFKRDLIGNLQAALGPLGTVEIVDLQSTPREQWEPLWKQVDERGLESLDNYNEVRGGKTHFLRVAYRDGQIELQARQHDGTSGFVTPLVRRSSTSDRAFASRIAGLMLGQDFGLVATLEPASGDDFFLTIKGGGLGPVDRWLKKDEVFALVKLQQERRRLPVEPKTKSPPKINTVVTGARIEGALLWVREAPRNGRVRCQLLNRYEDPLTARSALGYRCVKLGTTSAPLRLQLVDPSGTPHRANALQVYARPDKFPDAEKDIEATTPRDGVFDSNERRFDHVAFVRVTLGNRRLARIPVEILDDGVTSRVLRLDPDAEVRDRFDSEKRSIVSRITDGRLIQVRCFQDITAMEKADEKKKALDRGEDVLKVVDAIAADARDELDKLKDRITRELPNAAGLAADCEQQLQVLKVKQAELRTHLDALKEAIAQDSDPAVQEKKKRITDLVRKAELLASQGDYDEAIKAYEDALAAAKDEPAAAQKIDVPYQALKKAWALREGDAAHAEARTFVYSVWAKLATPQDVRDQLAAARRHFEKCKSVGDRLTLNKMHVASVEVAARFSDELKKLIDNAMEEEEKKTLEMYVKVNEDLQKLLKDVQDFLLAKAKK